MNDSFLLNWVNSINDAKLQRLSFYSLSFWMVFPLIAMMLNLLSVDGVYVYTFWMYAIYFVGTLGLIAGFFSAINHFYLSKQSFRKAIADYSPVVFLFGFIIWSLAACLLSSNKSMAFYGVIPMTSSWFTFLFFGGFLIAAIICAKDNKSIVSLAKLFVLVSFIQAIVTIVDNDFSFKANIVEPFTNCNHYQSVFYNTNHYAYYLLITIMVTFFLIIYSKQVAERAFYTLSFVLFVTLLILNNTFGAYLSITITIVVVLLSFWLQNDKEKRAVLFLSLIFLLTSIFSLVLTNNLKDSVLSFFVDTSSIVNDQEVESVGSGRGALWKAAVESIKISPMFGYGFENRGAVEPERFDEGEQLFVVQPHNFLLFFAKSTGLPGLCLYLAALLICAVKMVRSWAKMPSFAKASFFVVMSYLMSAFFGVVKFYTSPYYVVVLGICLSVSAVLNKSNQSVADF